MSRNNSLIHFLPMIVLLAFLVPASDYRHLWQDEVETAERAKSIVSFGVPTIIDPFGHVSLNGAGREMEEGTWHRYTPWAQFYFGAAGLLAGNFLGWPQDFSIRVPFVVGHAATSSLLSAGLSALCGVSPPVAALTSTLFGLQTVRLMNNRTARYHVLLDLFFLLGMIGIGLRKRNRRQGEIILAMAVFILPQVQTLGGSLLASLLVVLSLLEGKLYSKLSHRKVVCRDFVCLILPTLVSLGLVVWLSRPWLHGFWTPEGGPHHFRSLSSGFEINYSIWIFGFVLANLFWQKERRLVLTLASAFLYTIVAVRVLDLYPFSQTRYYISLPIFFLFWPIAFPQLQFKSVSKLGMAAFLIIVSSLPELVGSVRSWQGVRVVASDLKHKRKGQLQPLHELIQFVKNSDSQGPILFDYVPQFSNWYFPGLEVPLMPDRAATTPLNEKNPLWLKEVVEPQWHAFYSVWPVGQWVCLDKCDYSRKNYSETNDRYELHSKVLNKSFKMCIVKKWRAEPWNNSPFRGYVREAVNPEGSGDQQLILARRCD